MKSQLPTGAIGLALLVWAGALTSGCQPKPAPVCLRYAACQAAYDDALGHTQKDASAYAAGGACWSDGQTAARCQLECEEALSALASAARAHGLDVPSCTR